MLGCSFPVSSADFWLCLRKFCGQADRGRLAGQRREFKFHRKSAAQIVWCGDLKPVIQINTYILVFFSQDVGNRAR